MSRLGFLSILLLSFVSLDLLAGVEIYLKKSAIVSGESVSLGDVSSIKVDETSFASDLKSKLEGLVLGRFSPGEKNRSLSYSSIQGKIRSLFKGEFYLIGREVKIERSSFSFKEEDIRKKIVRYLKTRATDTRIKIDFLSKERDLFSHHETDKLIISIVQGSLEAGTIILNVKTANSLHSLRVRCQLHKLQAVAIAKKDISLTTKLTPADYEIKKVLRSTLSTGFVEKIKAGTIALRDIKAGAVIKADDIRTPLLIKYGDIVTVLFQEAGVSIKMRAKAIKEGRAGDIIELENVITYRRFYGKIDSKGCVLISIEGN